MAANDHRQPCPPSWVCADCLILLANGETDPSWTETETTGYLARVAHGQEGAEITLGMLAGYHDCTDDTGKIADECECEDLTFSLRHSALTR